MSNKKYSIGLDFGTQSGRAILVEIDTGTEVTEAVTPYKHGVIDEYLPETNLKLSHDWALQDPADYINVLVTTVPKVMRESGVNPEDVIGIGIDFTSCTILPITKDGEPLCKLPEYRKNPHSWVKLWKHHAAQLEASDINEIATQRNESFLSSYGGRISSESLLPKVWQILKESPDIYFAADSFMEAGDWVTMKLTGVDVRNSCAAGYKAMWSKKNGYPSKEFFKALDPRLENIVEEKLKSPVLPVGSKAGELSKDMAEKMGLIKGISVSVANVDAHVAAPAVNVVDPGKMLMIMGTSGCHMLLSNDNKIVKGVCGIVEDGIIQGYYGYEAGQAAVGDMFEWFVDNQVPESYMIEARERDINIHVLLEEKASKLKPGESGLLALDWWNGNRSMLVDADLTGLIIGATLLTKPEEIYRALIEATAFGTNAIIQAFEAEDIHVNELYACGGLPEKNKMLMQIYSDITNMEIRISASKQTVALGSAMFGAVAAGKEKGGYDNLLEAAKNMARLKDEVFRPINENVEIYRKLYVEYKKLHDYFGKGGNDVMKVLKTLKSNA